MEFYLVLAGLGWTTAALLLMAWSWWRPSADDVCFATTSDGWKLALHEIRPDPSVRPAARPVILCHGILMSRHCWIPHAGVPSLVEQLRKRGYWLWIVELRGSGKSHPARADGENWNYGFRDYADHDVDAIVEEVKRRTNSETVDWIGHSLGGMVAYAYLSRMGTGSLHKVVTLGSSAMLGFPHNRIPAPAAAGMLHRIFRSLDLSWVTKPVSPLMMPSRAPWVAQFINLRGISRRFGLGLLTWGIQRSSSRMLHDFHGWQRANGPFVPQVAKTDPPYASPPGGLLALHGRKDYMAPPRNVSEISQVFPDALVEPADTPDGRPFGHLDLLAGPTEVDSIADRLHEFLTAGSLTAKTQSPRRLTEEVSSGPSI